jgi:plasmid maintenance system killer protein
MGIDEFEKNLEKKIEQERDAERQRMLRELKNHKFKTKKDESLVVPADEA